MRLDRYGRILISPWPLRITIDRVCIAAGIILISFEHYIGGIALFAYAGFEAWYCVRVEREDQEWIEEHGEYNKTE